METFKSMLSEKSIEGDRLPFLIDGKAIRPTHDTYFDSYDPTTGQPWHKIAEANAEDVNHAVESSLRAFQSSQWANLTQTQRGELLYKLGDLIGTHADRLALIETRDNGKLLKETSAQVSYLRDYYRYFAGISDKIQGETIPLNKSAMLNYTRYEPLGVVAIIVPWNSPLNTLSVSVAPSLAVGNTVVIKPSEHTSATALEFAKLALEAGFPEGVVNVITGPGETTGHELTRHPSVAKIAFTGGTQTGRKVAKNAAENLVSCNLELGGKSPQVIYADADFDRALNGVVAGVFAASGQTCVAGSRAFVERPIYDDFVQALVERANMINIGIPTDDKTQMGPLALKAQLDKVTNIVSKSVHEGAQIVAGGERLKSPGWFFPPTVAVDVNNSMNICKEEIFGPVVCVMPFDNEKDLIKMANDTTFGLAAGIWTRDIDKAMRFTDAADAGTVWVNTYRTAAMMSPMGGFKDSGYGKHNGFAAIDEFARLKNVVVDYSGKTQDPFVIKLK